MMVMLGTDAHKKSHTIVAVDPAGADIGLLTVAATTDGHLRAMQWAAQFDERRWAIEDCRALSRRLEGDLLGVGERVVRVPPKMMARARATARGAGKSDPIDALAVGRAALREPDLPVAQLDGPSREVRLLVDYRETLVHQRTALQNQLRWRLHELEPGFDPPPGSLNRYRTLDTVDELLTEHTSMVADLAKRETGRIRELTREINQLERDIHQRVTVVVPSLLSIPGCGTLTAAKLVGEAADITRFRSKDAYAMWAGAAPIPVWSANNTRVRLNRGGNRQTNAALHRIAITQMRIHPDAQAFIKRRIETGSTKREAIRLLKRKLANVVYRNLLQDTKTTQLARAA
jgi:transposase